MEHVFSAWAHVEARLLRASHVFLFTDYDGTLCPIVKVPELAVLSPETRAVLGRLARHSRYTVGVISGRALKDVMDRVGIPGIIYAGNHGLEIQGPGIRYLHPQSQHLRPLLAEMERALGQAMASIPGTRVENKGLSVSVHYRLVENGRVGEVWEAFDRVVGPAVRQGRVRRGEGRRLLEVRPAVEWDKGRAVALILDTYRGAADSATSGGTLAVFLGDDRTDEDAFQVVNQREGLTIYVGDGRADTRACYYLDSSDQVREFLERLASMP